LLPEYETVQYVTVDYTLYTAFENLVLRKEHILVNGITLICINFCFCFVLVIYSQETSRERRCGMCREQQKLYQRHIHTLESEEEAER
jgi:hypothetical protein